MAKSRTGRYAQLDDVALAALKADVEVGVHADLNSFSRDNVLLPYYKKSLEQLRVILGGLACETVLITAYVIWSNEERGEGKRQFETIVSNLKNGLVKFLYSEGLQGTSVIEMDTAFIYRYIRWLSVYKLSSGENLSPNTQRKYYGAVKALLEALRDNTVTKHHVAEQLTFPDAAYSDAHNQAVPTEVVDDVTMRKVQVACIKEISEIIDKVQDYNTILENVAVPLSSWNEKRGMYLDFTVASAAFKVIFDECLKKDRVPTLKDVKKIGGSRLHRAITHKHGLAEIALAFYPNAANLVPFVLLLSIYSLANTGPLRSLRLSKINQVDVMGVSRIRLTFDKRRAHSYYDRSFAVDEKSPFSPGKIIEFMRSWTKCLRAGAGEYADHLFIFAAQSGAIRAFHTSVDSGIDSDSSWNHAARQFFERHELPRINLSEVRFSGADTVREIEDDDVRAVAAVLGHRRTQTGDEHYDSAGAKRARYEYLAHGMSSLQRWARTRGTVDGRKESGRSDLLAATPGFSCIDPYDSPVPGELKGRLCEAYGACPACPQASVSSRSAYSLARCLQLFEELKAARLYLPTERWDAAYMPSWKAMPSWIAVFDDLNVVAEAKKLNLTTLGKLE